MMQTFFSKLLDRIAAITHRKSHFGKAELLQFLISLLAALFIWTYISWKIAPNISKELGTLPVTIDMSGSKAESYGLSLLPGENDKDLTVEATINGTRASLGALTRDDVVAYVDFDTEVANIVGKQTLSIRLRRKSGAPFNEADVQLTPSRVTLDMDSYESRTLPVEVNYSDLNWDDETRISTAEITCEPSSVQVYGPSSLLSSLDHIQVNVTDTEPLTQTKTFADCTNYTIIDQDNNPVKNDSLSVDKGRYSVRIPVFYSRKLPITVNLTNVPDGFHQETVLERIRLNANGVSYKLPDYGTDEEILTISIETTNPQNKEQLDGLNAWQIESLSLSQLSLGTPVPVTIKMDEGFTDSSQIGTVYVSLDNTGLETVTRWVNNSDIDMMNNNLRYHYALESPGGKTPITLIGPPDELEKIQDEDLKASVNLINIPVSSEAVYQQTFTVTLPETVHNVWVSPAPSVNIAVTLS